MAKIEQKVWGEPKLIELSVTKTLTATNVGKIETLTGAGLSGRCCS